MAIGSYGYRYALVGEYLDFVLGGSRNGNTVLPQLVDHQVDDFLDVPECLVAGGTPRGGAVLLERRAIGMPAVIIRLHDYFKGIGLHCC